MSDVAKVRALVEHVFAATGMEVPSEHVVLVLMVLDSHALLKFFPGTPAEYHAHVQQAYTVALRRIMEEP